MGDLMLQYIQCDFFGTYLWQMRKLVYTH